MKNDQFPFKIANLAVRGRLGLEQQADLRRGLAANAELRRIFHLQNAPKKVILPRSAAPIAPEAPQPRRLRSAKQVTGECKICHLPWPHVTKFARSRHGLRLLARRGTRTRQRILRKGQPWGEKFRAMGRAAMARNYTARRLAVFQEVAPRAFALLGRDAIEDLINRRKHRYVRDKMNLFRRWAETRYGGVRLKKPWVQLPKRTIRIVL
jgi:hypothetical protein